MDRARYALRALLAAVVLLSGFAHPAAAQTFDALTGKTVRFIIGANAGGTTDRFARVFIDALRPLLPGTTLLAQNVPGGDGQLALVEASAAGRNVVTAVFLQAGPIYDQLRQPTVPSVDIGRFRPIGSLASNQRMVGIRASLGVTTLDELVALDRQLVTLTNSVTASNHMEAILFAAMTGVRLKVVTGVSEDMRDSLMLAGEVDLSVTPYLSLRKMIEAGVGIAILRTGTSGYPPDLAALPTLADVLPADTPPGLIEAVDTLNVLGRMLMAVPETDEMVVDALRAAFDEVVASPAVAAAYAAQSFDLSPTPGIEVERRMVALLGNEAVAATFRAYLACGEEEAESGKELDCAAR